jgi:hypothetical protein
MNFLANQMFKRQVPPAVTHEVVDGRMTAKAPLGGGARRLAEGEEDASAANGTNASAPVRELYDTLVLYHTNISVVTDREVSAAALHPSLGASMLAHINAAGSAMPPIPSGGLHVIGVPEVCRLARIFIDTLCP